MRTIPEADIIQLLDNVKGQFPNGAGEAVDHWVIEQGPDSTDDPAIWVWVILQGCPGGPGQRRARRNQIRDLIQGLPVRSSTSTLTLGLHLRSPFAA
ncbi:MAG: hypothetical protein IPI35_31855 [Deltaproteobacteria bacterium]|nr:hypothetical protein [Deltaproteobacteria bacterium]